MKRNAAILFVALLSVTLGGGAVSARVKSAPTPTPMPTATPVANPHLLLVARREFLAWQLGSIDRSHYVAGLAAAASPQRVKQTSVGLIKLGGLISLQYLGLVTDQAFPGNGVAHAFRAICTNGDVYEEIALNPKGLVRGILFRDTLVPQ